jgi:hypothetical protein
MFQAMQYFTVKRRFETKIVLSRHALFSTAFLVFVRHKAGIIYCGRDGPKHCNRVSDNKVLYNIDVRSVRFLYILTIYVDSYVHTVTLSWSRSSRKVVTMKQDVIRILNRTI